MDRIKILFLLIVPIFNLYGQSIKWKKLNENISYSLIENNSSAKVGIKDSVKVDLFIFDLDKKIMIKRNKQLNKPAYSFYDNYRNVQKTYVPVEFHDSLLKRSEYIFKIKTIGKNSYIISFVENLGNDQLKHFTKYLNRKYTLLESIYSTKENNIKKNEIWSNGLGVKIIHPIYTTLKITTIKEVDFNIIPRRMKKNIIDTSSYLSNKKSKIFFFKIKT
ncbi:hypothetical protein J3D55_003522 [Chryseobacterium ginsenosidimutans]|uniref:hypothetical protein n=1 Tax=Chryseobacterium ginsenosidimutans TaxID=687846 RepID=UPI002167B061|nr:hypothetical protein [Chryseobacterium ginsenosidimutans]MCS3870606.1 hypothetical protein [Chryseobacterium ginsenosidimutans]